MASKTEMTQLAACYYADKSAALAEVFGANEVLVDHESVTVDGVQFPVIDDVIVLLAPDRYTKHVIDSLGRTDAEQRRTNDFAPDVQYTFGQEWQAHPAILS